MGRAALPTPANAQQPHLVVPRLHWAGRKPPELPWAIDRRCRVFRVIPGRPQAPSKVGDDSTCKFLVLIMGIMGPPSRGSPKLQLPLSMTDLGWWAAPPPHLCLADCSPADVNDPPKAGVGFLLCVHVCWEENLSEISTDGAP